MVSNTSIESLPMQPHMSGAAMMVACVMLGHDYELGMGLGKNNDGMASLVDIKENCGKFGLSYKPTQTNVRRTVTSWKFLPGKKKKAIPTWSKDEKYIQNLFKWK